MAHRSWRSRSRTCLFNQEDYIDAVLSDDCDVFLFGGRTVIKNTGKKLSGNKSRSAQSQLEGEQPLDVMVYTAEAIQNHLEVGLSRGGMILVALLSGGDYGKGVDGFGKTFSQGLAHCGFGDQLLQYFQQHRQDTSAWLSRWRSAVNKELSTNSQGFLPPRPSLRLSDTFPDLQILRNYIHPINSGRPGSRGSGPLRDRGELNLGLLAAFCEQKFDEWGHKTTIIKRFRDLMWPAAVNHVLRRAALEADEVEKTRRIGSGIRDLVIRGPLKPSPEEAIGTSANIVQKYLNAGTANRYAAAFVNRGSQSQSQHVSLVPDLHPLITKIVGTRKHASTENLLEDRIEVSPVQLISITVAGIKGIRPDPTSSVDQDKSSSSPKKPPPHPDSILRVWIPAIIMHQVHPDLVEDFALLDETKKSKQATRRKKERIVTDTEGSDINPLASVARQMEPVPRLMPTNQSLGSAGVHLNEPRSLPDQFIDPWFFEGGDHDASVRPGFLFSFPDSDNLSLHEDVLHKCGLQIDEIPIQNNQFDDLFEKHIGSMQKYSIRTNHQARKKNAMPLQTSTSLHGHDENSVHQTTSSMLMNESDPEFSEPPTRVDRLLDEIMTVSRKKALAKKRASTDHERGLGGKRQKMLNPITVNLPSQVPLPRPFPAMLGNSGDNLPVCPSQARGSIPFRTRTTACQWLEIPTSSQESGQVSDEIIDLT